MSRARQWFKGNFQEIQMWATVALASFAAGGFALAFVQYRETGKILVSAAEAFEASTYPVVKFDNYQWNIAGPEPLSCENPARGFNAYFQNVSGVPIAAIGTDLDVFMGARRIHSSDDQGEVSLPRGELILGPGQNSAAGFDNAAFPEVYKRMSSMDPPHLNFDLRVNYRSLVTGKGYCYSAHVTMFDTCRLPQQRRHNVIDKVAECEIESQSDSPAGTGNDH